MHWHLSHRADPRALPLADAHYNRQKPGSPQFVPTGRCIVLLTERADALWVTSYPEASYVMHKWKGAWVCSCFRNENQYNRKNKGGYLSSRLITEAVAATRWMSEMLPNWGEIPELGMITFVDPRYVRNKEHFGECYLKAGFEVVGQTKKRKLIALQLPLSRMPEPSMPMGNRAKQLQLARQVIQHTLSEVA